MFDFWDEKRISRKKKSTYILLCHLILQICVQGEQNGKIVD